jgi:DNA-binding NarL/FixJ family response regulator
VIERPSSDERPVRVVIVDDHPIMREGTRSCLEQARGIEVVGTAGEGAKVLWLIAERHPDVLLLDLHLPDMSGVEVARQVHSAFPEVAILVLTGHDEAGYVRALLQMGIRGYLRKTVRGEEIVAAVRSVASGKQILISESLPDAVEIGPGTLTSRELQILRLLAAGQRNSEIATELGVTVKTVEYHITHVLAKLGVRSRAEAVRQAQQRGILLPGERLDKRW